MLTPRTASVSSGAFLPPEEVPKLLFDENLAARLAAMVADVYPDSTAVDVVGLRGASDDAIWAFAKEQGFVLVTKDEDFHRFAVLRGFPPKVLWIRLGNSGTADVALLLRARLDHVVAFVTDPEASFLTLG